MLGLGLFVLMVATVLVVLSRRAKEEVRKSYER